MITEKDLKTLFTSDEIQNAIKELGVRINSDYGDDELFLICVLKGAVMFTVDLSKHLKMLCPARHHKHLIYCSGIHGYLLLLLYLHP